MSQNLTVKKGKCINFGNCSKANAKEVIEVDLGDDFVCPECDGGLIEPPPKGEFSPALKWIIIIACIVVVLGAGGYFIWNAIFTSDSNGGDSPSVPSGAIYHPITPDDIILDKTSLAFEDADESEQLTATVLPANVPEKNKKVIWQSDDETVATVDSNGHVTAITNGNAVIAAYTLNGLSATCYITVGEVEITPDSIILNKTELTFNRADEKEQLIATVFPPDVSEENKKVFWTSSDEAVAKVDTNGLVSAGTNGHAVISAYTLNGLSDTCSVQVNKPSGPTPAQLNNLLNRIANADDNATDQIRRILGNSLRVEGAANISNVQQLITDVSNGSRYKVTRVNTNADGKVVSISVSK